jgi:hypothetical protein
MIQCMKATTAGGFTAGLYWAGGWAPSRIMYQQMYGGSPYDAAAFENYRNVSASFRTDHFAGPYYSYFPIETGWPDWSFIPCFVTPEFLRI